MTDNSAPDPAFEVFLDALVRLRSEAGLSPRELAQRLGVTEAAVVQGEAGRRRIDVVELQLWAFSCGSSSTTCTIRGYL